MMAEFTINDLAQSKVQQSAYRAILSAFSYPGIVYEVQHPFDALSLVLATLVDSSSKLADVDQSIALELWPLLACRPAKFEEAEFVVCVGAQFTVRDRLPQLGDLHYPHLGATMILVCSELNKSALQGVDKLSMRVTGPGVESVNKFSVTGLCVAWLEARAAWVARFPLGVDMVLCAANRIVGIPRTSIIEVA